MTIDPTDLRRAFGTFVTGVTVVTYRGPDGRSLGFTANSFTSVSLDPPLLLICIANASRNFTIFTEAPAFAVNILSEGQADISNTFARPVDDRFAGVDWTPAANGAPLLGGVSAWFSCTRHAVIPAGDHALIVGRVEAFEATPRPGLGYARGAYVTPALAAADPPGRVLVSALVARRDEVLIVPGGDGAPTIPRRAAGPGGRQGDAALTDRGERAGRRAWLRLLGLR